MQLYDAIFQRKSTRKYLPEVLPADRLAEIQAFTQTAKPLFPQIRARIVLAGADEVKGIVSARAPHYLLLYSEKAEGYLPNAGFLLQQADLYLSSLGLGSCWLGMAKTTAPAKDGLDYVIMLAFGKAQDSPHRKDISEFNRRPLAEITSGNDGRLEAARLAPSATNSQPWYFVCDANGIHVYRKKLGVLKSAVYNTMNQVDIGIALCHLWLASEQVGQPFAFSVENPDKWPNLDGRLYMGSVV